jgi:hypothetical protein
MTAHRIDNHRSLANWRNRADASGVVVRSAFMGSVSPVALAVAVAPITRQARDKSGPSGFEPRRWVS